MKPSRKKLIVKSTPICVLKLNRKTVKALRRAGIVTVEQFGNCNVKQLKHETGERALTQAEMAFYRWHEQKYFSPAPLPPDWKPVTQRGES